MRPQEKAPCNISTNPMPKIDKVVYESDMGILRHDEQRGWERLEASNGLATKAEILISNQRMKKYNFFPWRSTYGKNWPNLVKTADFKLPYTSFYS